MTNVFLKLRSVLVPTVTVSLPLVLAGVAVYELAPRVGLHRALLGSLGAIVVLVLLVHLRHRTAKDRRTFGWLFSDMHSAVTQVCVETVPILIALGAAGLLYWKSKVALGDLGAAMGFYLLYFAAWYPIFGAEARRDTEAHLASHGVDPGAVEAAGLRAERRAARASWGALALGTLAGLFGTLDSSITMAEIQADLNTKTPSALTNCPGKYPGALRPDDPSLCTKQMILRAEMDLQTRKITALCGVIDHMSADFKDDSYLGEASAACNLKPPPALPFEGAPTWPIQRTEPAPAGETTSEPPSLPAPGVQGQ